MSWEEVVEDFPQLADAAGPAWNYYNNRIIQDRDYNGRPGFDVNSDFNPDLDYVPQASDFLAIQARRAGTSHLSHKPCAMFTKSFKLSSGK
ncbi:hypothetical protein [Mesobacillus sp.]|uniref:hypothetical protein n=1 Tax=Mesobacillus sp. TaxID=2675271 RepID=UPI0039F0990D